MSTATQTTKRSKNELPASMIPVESTAARAKKMRDAAKPSAYDLAVTITLNALCEDVKTLNSGSIESPFESGEEKDSNAGWAMDMVSKEVNGMMDRNVSPEEFEVWLYRLGGVIACVHETLSNKDMAYARILKGLLTKASVFGEMVETANMKGDKFLQREVQA